MQGDGNNLPFHDPILGTSTALMYEGQGAIKSLGCVDDKSVGHYYLRINALHYVGAFAMGSGSWNII